MSGLTIVDPPRGRGSRSRCHFCITAKSEGVRQLLSYPLCNRCAIASGRFFVHGIEIIESPARASEPQAVRNLQAQRVSHAFGKRNGIIVDVCRLSQVLDYEVYLRDFDPEEAAWRFRKNINCVAISGERVTGISSDPIFGPQTHIADPGERPVYKPGAGGIWTPVERGQQWDW